MRISIHACVCALMRTTGISTHIASTLKLALAGLLLMHLSPGMAQGKYTAMRPDHDTMVKWFQAHKAMPQAPMARVPKGLRPGGSLSLLGDLNYIPGERNQGQCQNCWSWTGHGCMEILLFNQEGIFDRLSVQYLNSCQEAAIGKPCCWEGWLADVAAFYSTNGYQQAVPWSNPGASWQDGCDTPCASITTTPSYRVQSISARSINTWGVPQALAIANIKLILDQHKPVAFGFFTAEENWLAFCNFWATQPESATVNLDYACGQTNYSLVGHYVLCVGYNDDNPSDPYWIMVNSWGSPTNRPNGIFHLTMTNNYDCKFYHNYEWMPSYYWEYLDVNYTTEGGTNLVKYIQPPDMTTNGLDVWASESFALADDFVCTNAGLVTDIRLWCSWLSDNVDTNTSIWLGIYDDVPATNGPSHPGNLQWQQWFSPGQYTMGIYSTNLGQFYDAYHTNFLGTDTDTFYYSFYPTNAFRQQGTPGQPQVYWLAVHGLTSGTGGQHFGWKTSAWQQRDVACVASWTNGPPTGGWNPIYDVSFKPRDLAFKLTTCPPPTMACTNLTVECGSQAGPPSAWDNCCNTSLTPVQTGSVTNGACPWVITETWMATDCRGQTNTCTRLATVQDTTPPVITCASNITVQCGSAWNFTTPTASDTCCGNNVAITVSSTSTNGTCPSVISRVWKATDCCNNFNLCTQIVTVVETPPTIAITQPANGASFLVGTNVVVQATASDSDVQRVEFYVDGTVSFTNFDAYPGFTLGDLTAGPHTISAVAVDDGGLRGTNTISITGTNPPGFTVLVANGERWRYLDDGSNPDGAGIPWRWLFDDQSWHEGPAELGYGDAAKRRPERTVVGYGPDPAAKHATTYFRKLFVVESPGQYTNLVVRLLRDDGGIVYINGTEVFRSGITNEVVDFSTYTGFQAPDDGTGYQQTSVNPAVLVPGTNVVAVEIHQESPTGPDISFDLMLWGQASPLASEWSGPCNVSSNVVGYVQLTVPAYGQSLIANPLNNLGNDLNTILPLPDTAQYVTISRWQYSAQAYGSAIYWIGGVGWYSENPDPSWLVVNPGEGFFLENGDAAPLDLTFVGQVPEGNLTCLLTNNGKSYVSSMVPQARPLGTSGQAGTLHFPAADGDSALLYTNMVSYTPYNFYEDAFTWEPSDPVLEVAQGFVVWRMAADDNWTRNFVVSGRSGPGLAIALQPADRYVTLTWAASSDCQLQEANDPEGPWTARPGQTSPYTFLPSTPKRFFRLAQSPVAISFPGNQWLGATGPSGATAAFTVTATNVCTGGRVPVVCTPPAGSIFPVGVSTVDCVATAGGWTNHRTFTVTVVPQVSSNVVGYVRLSVPAGRSSLIANPLNAINNSLGGGVLTLPPSATNVVIRKFIPNVGLGDPIYGNGGQPWSDPTVTLNPGEGALLTNGSSPLNLTFVGEVLEGSQINPVSSGWSVTASKVPQALPLGRSGEAGTLRFPAASGDMASLYNGYNDAWIDYTFAGVAGWGPSNPVPGVAQAFLCYKGDAADWVQHFAVSCPSGPGLAIALGPADGYVTVTWDAPPEWQLQTADDLGGSWTSRYGQASPLTLVPAAPKQFFRLVNPLLYGYLTSSNTILVCWHGAGYTLQKRPAAETGWTDVPTIPVLVGSEYQASLDDLAGWTTEIWTCTSGTPPVVSSTTNLFLTTGLGWYWYNLTNTVPTNCNWVGNWFPTNQPMFFRLRK